MLTYSFYQIFMIKRDYQGVARQNEAVFGNVLRDLKSNRERRTAGMYIPEDLDSEAPLEEIFKKYSEGQRRGIFTILDF